jgi:hypothetical protein
MTPTSPDTPPTESDPFTAGLLAGIEEEFAAEMRRRACAEGVADAS